MTSPTKQSIAETKRELKAYEKYLHWIDCPNCGEPLSIDPIGCVDGEDGIPDLCICEHCGRKYRSGYHHDEITDRYTYGCLIDLLTGEETRTEDYVEQFYEWMYGDDTVIRKSHSDDDPVSAVYTTKYIDGNVPYTVVVDTADGSAVLTTPTEQVRYTLCEDVCDAITMIAGDDDFSDDERENCRIEYVD